MCIRTMMLASILWPLMLGQSAMLYANDGLSEQRETRFDAFETRLEIISDQLSDQQWSLADESVSTALEHWLWLQDSFPPSETGTGRLRDSIWAKGSDFPARMNQVLRDLERLQREITAHHQTQAEAALDAVEDSCRSCHRRYRSFW